MKRETAAWVDKAEADFVSAQREFRARNQPNYDAACFHAQQSGEKYLKARLVEAGIAFPKTHSLTALLHQILALEPDWTVLKPEAAQLTVYAVEFRYPGKSADKPLAKLALAQCKSVRAAVRRSLGLDLTQVSRTKRRKSKISRPATKKLKSKKSKRSHRKGGKK